MHSNPASYLSTAKVLGPDGRPWQEQHGYEPGMSLPHVLTFSSIIGSAWKTYYHGHHDDAIRNDPEFAIAMRRDPQLMRLLQERKMSVVSLKWHLEIDDERNEQHKAVRDGLTTAIKATPRLKILLHYLAEAIWVGRYASQLDYRWTTLDVPDPANPKGRVKKRAPVIHSHIPVDGDKIDYHHDGTPYIQVYGARASEIPGAEVISTTASRAIVLDGSWRRKFIIHKHEALDAPYQHAEQAGRIHGTGIRHVLYWLSWLKKELLANILDYCERTGLGLRVWYYQGGNPTSQAEVERAASLQTNRTNVIVPRFPNQMGKSSEAVEFVDTGSNGAMLLLEILKKFDADMELYVVGQTLSSGTEGGGLGGTGVAGMHEQTKHRLTAFDADNLADTLTADLVRPMLAWMYPEYAEMPCQWVFDTSVPNPAEQLAAVQTAWSMGVTFEENSIRQITGMPAPQEGDTPISQMAMQQAQQQMQLQAQQQMQAMAPQQPPGAGPGGPPQDGDGDGLVNESPDDGEPTEADYQQLVQQLTGGAA